MMLHCVCLVATDEGVNSAIRSHAVSNSLNVTQGLPAENKSPTKNTYTIQNNEQIYSILIKCCQQTNEFNIIEH